MRGSRPALPVVPVRESKVRTCSVDRDGMARPLDEKEVLLREVHHRVKNNLQIICSLLQLQASRVQDPLWVRLIREMRNRVRSMALVHDRLCHSSDLSRIDFREYVQEVTTELFRSYRADPSNITLAFDICPEPLNLDTAILVGLIINELVANSLKYAFPPGFVQSQPDPYQPEIRISLSLDPEREFTLTLCDNGVGLPPGIGLDSEGTMGIQIAVMLVEQLNGSIVLRREAGTGYVIGFSQVSYPQRH